MDENLNKISTINSNPRVLKNLERYRDLLLAYNREINIVSKKLEKRELDILINESLYLDGYSAKKIVVDAGSGSGLLGIPLAIANEKRSVFLVEPKKKKTDFLTKTVKDLGLENVSIYRMSIKEFFTGRAVKGNVLISRGFPDNIKLTLFLKNGKTDEMLLITSLNKIKKMKSSIEKFKQSIYNIPFRDQIKIIKLENVSRETKQK